MKRCFLFAALTAAVLGSATPARALFGVGDIVYDPANVAQTINLVRQAQQEFDRLGSVLGVSTRQLDQLLALTATLGTPSPGAAVAGPLPADAAALLRADGQLDAFLGLTPAQWVTAIENPQQLYRSLLLTPAAERAGIAAGSSSPPSAAAYSQWANALSDEDRANLSAQNAADVAAALNSDWLQQARTRRDSLQALSAAGATAESQAAAAKTLSDQAGAHAQLSAQTNRILLETAAQATAAHEASVRAVAAQTQLLASAASAQRDQAVMMLDASY